MSSYKLLTIRKLIASKPVGICNFAVGNNNIFIHNIQVNKSFRNQHIGTFLLNQVEDYSIKNDIDTISLVVKQKPLDSLTEFYFKNGYKKISEEVNYYDDGETTYDLIRMEKQI